MSKNTSVKLSNEKIIGIVVAGIVNYLGSYWGVAGVEFTLLNKILLDYLPYGLLIILMVVLFERLFPSYYKKVEREVKIVEVLIVLVIFVVTVLSVYFYIM